MTSTAWAESCDNASSILASRRGGRQNMQITTPSAGPCSDASGVSLSPSLFASSSRARRGQELSCLYYLSAATVSLVLMLLLIACSDHTFEGRTRGSQATDFLPAVEATALRGTLHAPRKEPETPSVPSWFDVSMQKKFRKRFADPQKRRNTALTGKNVVCVEGPHRWANAQVLESIYINVVRPLGPDTDVVVVAPDVNYAQEQDGRHFNTGRNRVGKGRTYLQAEALAEFYLQKNHSAFEENRNYLNEEQKQDQETAEASERTSGAEKSPRETAGADPGDNRDQVLANTIVQSANLRSEIERTHEYVRETKVGTLEQPHLHALKHSPCLYKRIFGKHLKALDMQQDETRLELVNDFSLEWFRDSNSEQPGYRFGMHLMASKWKCLLAMRLNKLKLSSYDWFAYTRNDVFWAYPHPPPYLLNHEKWMQPGTGWGDAGGKFDVRPVDIWIPACFDYAGINDRLYTIRLRPGGDFQWTTAAEKKKKIREQIRKAKKVFFRFTRAVYARPGGMPMVRADALPPPNASDPTDVSWRFLKGFEGGIGAQEVNGEFSFRRFLDAHDFKIGRFDCIAALVKMGQLANDLISTILPKVIESKMKQEEARAGNATSAAGGDVVDIISAVTEGTKSNNGSQPQTRALAEDKLTVTPAAMSTDVEGKEMMKSENSLGTKNVAKTPTVKTDDVEDEENDPYYCRELQTPGFSEVFGRHRISFRNHLLFDATVQLNSDFQPNGVQRWFQGKAGNDSWTIALPLAIPDEHKAAEAAPPTSTVVDLEQHHDQSDTSDKSKRPGGSKVVDTYQLASAAVLQELSNGTLLSPSHEKSWEHRHPDFLPLVKAYRHSHDGVMKFSQAQLDLNQAPVDHAAAQAVLQQHRAKPDMWSAYSRKMVRPRLGTHMFLQRQSCESLVRRGLAQWNTRYGDSVDWFRPDTMEASLDEKTQPKFVLEQFLTRKNRVWNATRYHNLATAQEDAEHKSRTATTSTATGAAAAAPEAAVEPLKAKIVDPPEKFSSSLSAFVQEKLGEAVEYLVSKYCDTAPIWWEPGSATVLRHDTQHVWTQMQNYLKKHLDERFVTSTSTAKTGAGKQLENVEDPDDAEGEREAESLIAEANAEGRAFDSSSSGGPADVSLSPHALDHHVEAKAFARRRISAATATAVSASSSSSSTTGLHEQSEQNEDGIRLTRRAEEGESGTRRRVNEIVGFHAENLPLGNYDRTLQSWVDDFRYELACPMLDWSDWNLTRWHPVAHHQYNCSALSEPEHVYVHRMVSFTDSVQAGVPGMEHMDLHMEDRVLAFMLLSHRSAPAGLGYGRELNLQAFGQLYASQNLGPPPLGPATPFDDYFFMYNHTLLCKPYDRDVAYTWNRGTAVVKQQQQGFLLENTLPERVRHLQRTVAYKLTDHQLLRASGIHNRSREYLLDFYDPAIKPKDGVHNWGAYAHYVEMPRTTLTRTGARTKTNQVSVISAPYGEEPLAVSTMVLSRRLARYFGQQDPGEPHPDDLYTDGMRHRDNARGLDIQHQRRFLQLVTHFPNLTREDLSHLDDAQASEENHKSLHALDNVFGAAYAPAASAVSEKTLDGDAHVSPSTFGSGSSVELSARLRQAAAATTAAPEIMRDAWNPKLLQRGAKSNYGSKQEQLGGSINHAVPRKGPSPSASGADEHLQTGANGTFPTRTLVTLNETLSSFEANLDPVIDYDEYADRNFRRAHRFAEELAVAKVAAQEPRPEEETPKTASGSDTKAKNRLQAAALEDEMHTLHPLYPKYYAQMKEAYESQESGHLDVAHIPSNLQLSILEELNKEREADPGHDETQTQETETGQSGDPKYQLFKSRTPRKRVCAGIEYFSELPFGYSTIDFWEPEAKQQHARDPGQKDCLSCWLRGPKYSQNTGWMCWKAKGMKVKDPSRCCGRLETPFLHANLWTHYPRTDCLLAEHLCSDFLFGMWRRSLKTGLPNVQEAQRPDRREYADTPLSNLIY
ncbi:unnamed protein product [Amoebophrya sp. A120]|nr:unnamed protein product [Amoebophrya sp. A120]|eukprot:GSA120T00015065001.1